MQAGIRYALVACLLAIFACFPESAAAAQKKIQLQWFGQSATKITTVGGKVIMIDPWLTENPKTPPEYKNLDAIGKIDIILVTHAHEDHLGDGPELAKKYNAPLWGPAGLDQSLQTLGILPPNLAPRMGKGGTIQPFPGVKITQVHAEHSSELVWHNPATGKDETHVGGEPVGFIIELENGFRIYHMGDTSLFGDMKLIAEHYRPDLIMIPIGGHFVMNPQDAAFATKTYFKPKHAIPMHYGTSPFLVGTPAQYIKAMGKTPTKIHDMKPGDTLEF
jgi:L-ascorbate metabolism protein UlaG (beta-lactamase superfamily)